MKSCLKESKERAILHVERFGDKACCFEDLRPYISTLEGDEMVRWTSHLDSEEHNSVTAHAFHFIFVDAKIICYNVRLMCTTCDADV